MIEIRFRLFSKVVQLSLYNSEIEYQTPCSFNKIESFLTTFIVRRQSILLGIFLSIPSLTLNFPVSFQRIMNGDRVMRVVSVSDEFSAPGTREFTKVALPFGLTFFK